MNRLKELREERQYSLYEVASYLCIDFNILKEYENEILNINKEILCKLTKYYQTNADYILGFDNGYLYAEIENMKMVINFKHEEYLTFDKEKIYYLDDKRYIDLNDITTILKYQEFVNNKATQITNINWNDIKDCLW